jgi:hypothetical protein
VSLTRNQIYVALAAAAAVIVIVVILLMSGGGSDAGPVLTDDAAPVPTEDPLTDDLDAADASGEATPTPAPAGPVEPLTGVPLDGEPALDRPALMVKLDNHPQARPQIGLNQADQGIELLVEGITRLALVFHTSDSDPVGPVRSGRSSDPDLAANYGMPLFAWSGGNATVRAEVRQGEIDGKLYDVGIDQGVGEWFRDSTRGVDYEHTLFSSTPSLFAAAPEELGPPPQIFDYRYGDSPLSPSAQPIPGVQIDWRGGVTVNWVWSDEHQGWLRFQRGTPHVDVDGIQVAPPNVVILTTPYGTSAASAGSPQALTVGEGDALVLTDGHAIEGRWSRPEALVPWQVSDLDGDPIGLTPGQTWIGLPEEGNVAIMSQARADELLATAP